MNKPMDIIGKKFNRLTVLELVGTDKYGNTKFLCECDCGKTKVLLGSKVKGGRTKSCQRLLKNIIGRLKMLNKEKTITISLDEYNRLLESQKQVDELTDKLGKVLLGVKADEMLVAKGVEQAVKDTAKEICDLILEHWEKKQFVECDWLRVAISERYGVEVE